MQLFWICFSALVFLEFPHKHLPWGIYCTWHAVVPQDAFSKCNWHLTEHLDSCVSEKAQVPIQDILAFWLFSLANSSLLSWAQADFLAHRTWPPVKMELFLPKHTARFQTASCSKQTLCSVNWGHVCKARAMAARAVEWHPRWEVWWNQDSI